MIRLLSAAVLLLLATACDAKPEPAASAPAAAAKPTAAAKPAESAEASAAEPAAADPAAVAAADPLGARFRDPPWFSKKMFGDTASAVDTARSEANEAGLFKSHIVFELAAGTTVEACADDATAKLAKFVPTLDRATEPGDRLKLTGSADRYNVTIMCGESKGTMRAYVAYEWLK